MIFGLGSVAVDVDDCFAVAVVIVVVDCYRCCGGWLISLVNLVGR